LSGGQVEKNDKGWACGRYGGENVAYRILVRKSGTTQRLLVRPCVDGSIVFKWIFKKYYGWA